jgi:hypothetical protein
MSTPFVPYADESAVLHVGNLTIENRLDRVTLSGDVDLGADLAGLADARRLQQVLAQVVAALEARALPDKLPAPVLKTVPNPFE